MEDRWYITSDNYKSFTNIKDFIREIKSELNSDEEKKRCLEYYINKLSKEDLKWLINELEYGRNNKQHKTYTLY